jgi:hypothetical protein
MDLAMDQPQNSADSRPTGMYGHYHYNPVNVADTVGTFVLGIVAVTLLIALLRVERRYHKLLDQHTLPQVENLREG